MYCNNWRNINNTFEKEVSRVFKELRDSESEGYKDRKQ